MTSVKLDWWVHSILCDPIAKSPITVCGDWIFSDYGRRYPIVDGIYDLRSVTAYAGTNDEKWYEGQEAFERLTEKVIDREDFAAQRRGMVDVYDAFPILGRCLDVGGNDGRLRAFLAPGQQYVSLDPFIHVVKTPRGERYKAVYPFADETLNFIVGMAEQLPFVSQSFDTVHIRSAIDHFQSAELALREAFRVLREDGRLIVGLLVKGGRTGKDDTWTLMKEALRVVLVGAGLKRFADHHIWHPTYTELCGLLQSTGFRIDHTYWQTDRVCYIRAMKVSESSEISSETASETTTHELYRSHSLQAA